jgi:hypothetical protein
MHEHDEVYGEARRKQLLELLRALAGRIEELDRAGGLLDAVPELLKRLGDLRSELFHYEVRSTYDTPEISESRRILDEATRNGSLFDEPEDDQPWRRGQ